MKKIYALVAFTFIAATSFGQRQLDMELKLSTPVEGSTVAQSATQQVSFTLKHSGDALVEGDTLVLYYYNFTTSKSYSLVGQQEGFANNLPVSTQIAAAFNSGQAIPSSAFNNGQALTLNTTATGFNVNDEILVVVEFYPLSTNAGEDTLTTNDFGSFKLGAPVAVSDFDNVSLTAYPNPAVSELNVTASEEVVSLTVLNLEGKVILTSAGNKVDVSTLTSGVYLYEATTVGGLKAVKRFVKQ